MGFFNISGCSVFADDNVTFSLKSQIDEIGINHDIIIRDGQCSEIRDLYGITSDCSKGIIPIITKQSNLTSFVVNVEGDEKYTFVQTSFKVKVSECPIGFGISTQSTWAPPAFAPFVEVGVASRPGLSLVAKPP